VFGRMSPERSALRRGERGREPRGTGVLRSLRRVAVAVALVASLCVTVQVVSAPPASAAATVPAPAGQWLFSEGSGTTTADSSGNGHTGTLGSGVTWAAPEVGAHSIATNGTATGAVTVTGAVVNTSASYTASAWVYLNAIGGANETFVSINGLASPAGTTISGFYLQFQGGTDQFAYSARASDSTGATLTQALGPANVAAGTWYHIVGVDNVSAGTIALYVNGSLQATTAFTSAWQATGNTMIGQGMYSGAATDFVTGKIDDVALYSSALTAAQVAALNPPVIATGLTTTCEISSGNASCWGDNSTGTLGDNSTVNSSVPVPVYTGGVLAGVTLTQISVGSDFACALSSAGAAYCWGFNSSGQLGNGTTTSSNVPVLVSGGLTFTQIDAGSTFACALSSVGAAYCWGNDGQDQLGNTTLLTNSDVPVAVTGGLAFAQISLGTSFACALTTAVPPVPYCWGKDNAGQIGNTSATNPQASPLAVTTAGTPLAGVTLTQINAALSGSTACALSAAGAAYCWGLGSSGQLGNGSTTAAQTTAVAVTATGVLAGVTLTQISGGQDQTCALGSTGAAYCWGGNGSGDLGINSTTQSLVPVAVSTSGVLSGKFLTQISASGNFISCAVGSFGAAYCWGANNLGQGGNPDTLANTTGYFPVPVAVSPSQATTIAAGYEHTCVIFFGSAYCWGDNTYGELGNNSTVGSTSPATVAPGAMPGGTVLVQVTTGNGFSCALSAAGAVYCWGLGTSGQLGNGSSVQSNVPVLVSGGLTFTGISAGGSSACGVTSAGAAYCWGLGTSGQLGNNLGTTSSSPVAVYTAGVLSGLTVTQVSVGGSAACALATTGAVFCWGLGTSGQLGNGGTTSSNQPVTVSAGGVAYSEVSVGGAFACAVSGSGAGYCWGDDTYGELGNNTTTSTPQSTPVAVYTSGVLSGVPLTQVAAGYDHACALSAAGAAYCWGLGTSGQLGNHATATSSVPVAVYTAGVLSGRTVTQISAGQYHTCGLDNLGTGYCWGLNSSGQDGRADTGTNFDAPVTIEPAGLDLISAGYTHSCTIRAGKAYCWGANTYGQLGNNSTVSSSVPVPVYTGGALSGVTLVQVVAGNGYTCALDSDGVAFCWGYNADGELGNNSTANSSVPVAVNTAGVLSGQTLTELTAGQYAACALSSAGVAYCWGRGTSGQLGNNTTVSSSVPVAVSASGLAFTAIDAGGLFACAVSTADTAYCWGANASGQLGNSTTTASSVPVLVNLPGAYVLTITAGFNHACLVSGTTSFVDYCWGDDTYGELGNGTTTATPQSTPVTLAASSALTGKSIAQLNAGYQSTCATDSTGLAYCWGENNDGQVGNNTTTTADAAVAVTATGVLAGKDITEISPGQYDTCALDSTGAAYCWGANHNGQAGNPATAVNFLVPVTVSASQTTTISAGNIHTCEINSGKAFCWGDNSNGELGNNSTMTSSVPVAAWTGGVLSGVTLTQIATGTNFSCALSAAGAAYCWGLGTSGQLGNNSVTSSGVPVPVYTGGVLSGVTLTQIATGNNFACALSSASAVYCWGAGGSGQLGNGSTTAAQSTAVAVTATGVLSGQTLTEISVGGAFACALSSAGAVYCWGAGGSGQLGNGSTTAAQSTAVAVTTSGVLSGLTLTGVTLGSTSACALSTVGAAYCWGAGGSGQLGNGSTTATQSTAVAVTTSGVLAGGVTLSQLNIGSNSSCALSTAGLGYCWGGGAIGQLGNGTTTAAQSTPVAVTATGVLSGQTLSQISVGTTFVCVLSNTGADFCWGEDSNGQLGNPDTADNFSVPVAVLSQATMIATGYNHSCLLRNGKAFCWGDDTYGELGNNTTTTTPVSTPVPVYTGGVLSGLTLIQISAGQDWTCALASTGAAYCWGNNSTAVSGDLVALGNNTNTASDVPVLVSGGLFFTQISVGGDFACGLTSAGVAYCWGNNHSGQMGNGGTSLASVPGAVTATSGSQLYQLTLTQIDAGDTYACALASTGAAYCWGLGTSGQLGNSASSSSSTAVAVTVSGVLSGVTLVQITTGGTSTCALGSAGGAYCWGAGGSGQLGNGSTTAIQNTAVAVTATSTGMPLAQITAGTSFACAVDVTGAAWCWGLGTPGDQLGNNLNASSSTPVAVTATGVLAGVTLFQISSGQVDTCTQGTTGAFYCWGTNTNGQLGNGSTTSSDVPVVVVGIVPGAPTSVAAFPGNTTAAVYWATPASLGTGTLTGYIVIASPSGATCSTTTALTCTITGLTNGTTYTVTVITETTDGDSVNSTAATVTPWPPEAIAAGGRESSCTIYSGKAYCWGDDSDGELGNGVTTATAQLTPVAVYTGGVLAGVTLTQITMGYWHVCALASTGAVYCWGLGTSGQLGNGGTASSNVPVLVSGGLTFTQISAGQYSMCGVTSAGAVYCWGLGSSGQLGVSGSTASSSTPVAVTTTGTALAGRTIVQVAAGYYHTCALDSTGLVYCWGVDTYGQVGTTTTVTSTPQPAAAAVYTTGTPMAGRTIVQITAGGQHTCALDSTGLAYCWGYGTNGQLGNNTATATNALPVAVYTAGALAGVTLATISATEFHTCALGSTGVAFCWGYNADGRLGVNNTTQEDVPTAVYTGGVLSGRTLTQVGAGDQDSCALDSTGTAYCWGNDANGQLGNDTTVNGALGYYTVAVLVDPQAPTNVTATPGDTIATVSWTAPVYLNNGTLTGYTVSSTPGTATCSTAAGTTTCTLTGLTDGTTYTVTVIDTTTTVLATTGTSAPSSPATVEPIGFLQLTSPASLTWAVTGTGLNRSVVDGNSGDQQLTATDNTATGAGWHITVSATTFTTGPKSLPNAGAVDFTGSVSSSLASTAPSATCVGSCTLPTDTTTYPVVMATAVSSPSVYTVYDTAAGTGEGVMIIGGSAAANPIGWWVQVPASTSAGSYTSTVTLQVVSGP
jgi:alpha-tubulin suppressor-like RCC1 family protein